jgi:hypothetical protein
MSSFQIPNELIENVNASANGLSKVKFTEDPLIPGHYSQITSIVSSAQKRHGSILEQAILQRLKQKTDLKVWSEQAFKVSQSAETLISTYLSDPSKASSTTMPYPNSKDHFARSMQVDMILYNKTKKSLTSFEIKRGNGLHDSKSKASMLKNLLTQQTLLKSYGKSKGIKEISTVDSKVIFYYGKCSLEQKYSLTSDNLDEYIDFEVTKFVEEVTSMFREKIVKIVEELIDPEKSILKGEIIQILEQGFEKQDEKGNLGKEPWWKKVF